MKNKKIILIFTILLILVLIGGIFAIWFVKNKENNEVEEITPEEEISEEQLRQTIVTLYFVSNETGEIMPEARLILSEAAIYMARAKKSNASYLAINKALEDVSTKDTGEIPMHIRNAPAEGMSEFGYGEGYKYPHNYPGHWVEQQYLPDKMVGTKYLGEI